MSANIFFRELRENKGMTQAEFAKSIGLTQQDISNIERGILHVTIELAQKIEDVYKIDKDKIIFYDKDTDSKKLIKKMMEFLNIANVNDFIKCIGVSKYAYNVWIRRGEIPINDLKKIVNKNSNIEDFLKTQNIYLSNPKPKNQIHEILSRLKTILNVDSDMQLCKKLNIPYPTLNTWKNRGEIPIKTMAQIAKTIDIGTEVQEDKLSKSQIISIPIYDVSASAGYGIINEETIITTIDFSKSFLRHCLSLADTSNLAIITARGDSMEPTISANSYIFIQYREPYDGQIAIVRIGSELYVKRLQKLPRPRLLSDNKSYEPIELEGQEYEIIGVVVGILKI